MKHKANLSYMQNLMQFELGKEKIISKIAYYLNQLWNHQIKP